MEDKVAALETANVELNVEEPATVKVLSIVDAPLTFNVEDKVAALETANVELNVEALETVKVLSIVEAPFTFNVEDNVAAFVTYKSPLNDASPDTLNFPFNEISSVTIDVYSLTVVLIVFTSSY